MSGAGLGWVGAIARQGATARRAKSCSEGFATDGQEKGRAQVGGEDRETKRQKQGKPAVAIAGVEIVDKSKGEL